MPQLQGFGGNPVNGDDERGGQLLLEQIMELWVRPEVERRQEAGEIETPFQLVAAQVVMEVGVSPTVRLNDEVRAVARVRAARPIERGESVTHDDFTDIEEIQLTDDDPNAAHVTLLLHQGQWIIAFDFRYNAERVAAQLEASSEFLKGAHSEFAEGRMRNSAVLLFQAVELLALARLLVHPDENVLTTRSHKHIVTKIHRLGKHEGNIDPKFPPLLSSLTEVRDLARYPQRGHFEVTEAQLEEWLQIAEDFAKWVETWAPTRAVVPEDLQEGR